MRFLHPNQTGIHPAGEKQSFVFWYCKHTAGDLRKAKRQQGARTPEADKTHDKKGGFAALCYFTYNKNRLELLRRLSFYHLRGDILHRIRHQTTTKQASPQA